MLREVTACPNFAQLESWLRDRFDGADVIAIEAHVTQCDRCLQWLRTHDTDTVLDSCLRRCAEVPNPEDLLNPELMERLCQLHPSGRESQRFARHEPHILGPEQDR